MAGFVAGTEVVTGAAIGADAVAVVVAASDIAAEVLAAFGAKGLVRFEGGGRVVGGNEFDDACCNCDCDCDREAEVSAPVGALEFSVSRFMSRGACRAAQPYGDEVGDK